MTPFGLYIHWPFCKSKCPYCDFNSHVRGTVDDAAWRTALLTELRYWHERTPNHQLHTIFFGGGTPSLMPPETVAALIDEAARLWPCANDVEVTLEANPTSIEASKFAAFRAAGVNRVSVGVQSLRDDQLKFLGRQHSAAEAVAALEIAAHHFPRFSFDLIYARPQQTIAEWRAELTQALKLARGHMSLYQLTIEENTGFENLFNRGAFTMPNDDMAGAFYEVTQEIMQAAGMPAYEISNHATPDNECRHNLIYWHYNNYVGIGPGAHGRVSGRVHDANEAGVQGSSLADSPRSRTSCTTEKLRVNGHATLNEKMPERWLNAVNTNSNGLIENTAITPTQARTEALMMGLRLTAGISRAHWRHLFGDDVLQHIHTEKLQKLIDENYMQLTETHITATASGRQRLQAVLNYLIN